MMRAFSLWSYGLGLAAASPGHDATTFLGFRADQHAKEV